MKPRLLVITPVRNEALNLERVARAMAAQTRFPDRWIVVDDGSTDGTQEILSRLEAEIDFLRVCHASQIAPRATVKDQLATAAEARAFNIALGTVDWRAYSHIAKLDGDTELPCDYFDRLLQEFAADHRLGLAGGVYADQVDGRWRVIQIPVDYHVPGTLKCYSRECFEAVGGIRERLAWDTIDETCARMRGFRTRAFPDLVALHHRPWGTADGTLRGRARHGECAYIVHFPPAWVLLRSLKVARNKPVVLSGLAFACGYARSAARSVPRVEDPGFRQFVRGELRGRLLRWLGAPKLGRAPAAGDGRLPWDSCAGPRASQVLRAAGRSSVAAANRPAASKWNSLRH